MHFFNFLKGQVIRLRSESEKPEEKKPVSRKAPEVTKVPPSNMTGHILELKKPNGYGKATDFGIIEIDNGPLKGERAFFPRSSLSLFGHNMSKANLMDVVNPQSFREFILDNDNDLAAA